MLLLDWRTIFASAVVGALVAYPITKGLDFVFHAPEVSGPQTAWYDVGSGYEPQTGWYDVGSGYSPGKKSRF
jgi:hypothetical protein